MEQSVQVRVLSWAQRKKAVSNRNSLFFISLHPLGVGYFLRVGLLNTFLKNEGTILLPPLGLAYFLKFLSSD